MTYFAFTYSFTRFLASTAPKHTTSISYTLVVWWLYSAGQQNKIAYVCFEKVLSQMTNVYVLPDKPTDQNTIYVYIFIFFTQLERSYTFQLVN